jgi:ABC-type hemin transport system ATPase subunit
MTRGIRVDVEGVSQRVRGHQILRDVSLAIAPGELTAVVGVSGAAHAKAAWREKLSAACAAHAGLGPASLVLYDVSTLYFDPLPRDIH